MKITITLACRLMALAALLMTVSACVTTDTQALYYNPTLYGQPVVVAHTDDYYISNR